MMYFVNAASYVSILLVCIIRSSMALQGTYAQRTLNDEVAISFNKVLNSLSSLLSLIHSRYELDGPFGGQFFLTTNNINLLSWDMLKYKLAGKILEGKETYLMVFGGSSVTAGHDSYYNQSYPFIVKKRLASIFSDLGIELIVRNIAQGANNCAPYILCYESMGGMNPDFVGWEQSYNCGHDDGIFETAARIPGWGGQKGGVVYYSASGAWSPKTCPLSTDPLPYSSEDWTPRSVNLTEWQPTLSDVEQVKASLFKFNQDKPTSSRFTGAFAKEYSQSVGLMGFNVWEKNRLCSYRNPKTNRTDACTGIDAAGGCAMRFMTYESSLYGSDTGKGADWHPTRAFHMLRGEAITWIYALVLFDAVHMVQSALKTKSKEHLLTEYSKRLDDLSPLPHPKKCHGFHCERRPTCHTDFKPHYSHNMTLTELVIGTTNWTYDAAEYGEWSTHYGYLDAKPLYTGTAAQGELHLRITIVDKKYPVWICGAQKESLLHSVIHIDMNVPHDDSTAAAVASYSPGPDRVLWHRKKYVGFECKALVDLPEGRHVLSIATNSTNVKHVTSLTHVIMWH